MTLSGSLHSCGWRFAEQGTGLEHALEGFLDTRTEQPRLLGLGEPTHVVEAFPQLRNRVFQHLVEHRGYRSIAVESDCLSALAVNDYVTSGVDELEQVLATGFSHGFGQLGANRELLSWIRDYNQGREPAQQVRFYGFDAPMEMSHAASPRATLTALHRYLTANLEPARVPHSAETLEALLGEDEAWTNPQAMMDPAQSIGALEHARQLRVLTDDLSGVLAAEAPSLIAATSVGEYERACLSARTGQGLLRYHAIMADTTSKRATQFSRLLAARDAMMAANLQAIAATERRRGPSLVFAHNQHLRRDRSAWQLADMPLCWWSAGAIVGSMLQDQYAVIAGDLSAAPERDIPEPEPDTLQGVLAEASEHGGLYPSDELEATIASYPTLAPRADTPVEAGYFGLNPADLEGIDAVAFLGSAS